MRKFMLILTLALSYLAVAGTVSATGVPPQCSPCPWVR
jgi:hypothetical protein